MSDYGLQITGTKYGTEKVIFDSRDIGRGTFQYAKGALEFGATITTKVSDLLMINLTRPSSGSANILVTAVKTRSGDNITWEFRKLAVGGSSINTSSASITGVNYVVLRDSATTTSYGTHGLQCRAYLGGEITFDSRMFTSTEGEVQLDPTQAYAGLYGHGSLLALGWNGAGRSGSTGDDYYSAFGLEESSWTGGTRSYGYLWTTVNVNNQVIYGSPYSGQSGSVIYSRGGSDGGVFQFSEINKPYSSPGANWEYPQALVPTFAGRKTLGTYDPQ